MPSNSASVLSSPTASPPSKLYDPRPQRMTYKLPPGLKYPLHFYLDKPWVKLGQPILLFEHLLRTYGPIAHYKFLGTPIIFVNTPEYIQEILINQASSFVK